MIVVKLAFVAVACFALHMSLLQLLVGVAAGLWIAQWAFSEIGKEGVGP